MAQKKSPRRQRKLLLRKKLGQRIRAAEEKATRKEAPRIKFTKTKVASLPHPAKGGRDVYRDTHTPHLCIRVTPTAKTFYWEKTVSGAQKRVTICRFPEINVEQARAQADDIAADYVKGIDVQEARAAKRGEGTFGELWDDYRERRRRKIEGKNSQALDYQWKRFFKQWENKQLSEITYSRAFRLINGVRKKAPFHANRVQRHGKAMFNFAKRDRAWRWSGENPFDFDFVSERGRARDVRLEARDMTAFMAGLESCSKSMCLLFLSSLYTGRRMGEVQAMRWVDLDLETGVWAIPQTKTGQKQEAMMPTALTEQLVERQRGMNSPWVFPSPSKSGHVEEIMKAWNEVREASGLHHVQARDLRRTLASWAQEVNVPIAAVQAQLGHASISTTAKHYTAISRDVKRAALEATVASMIQAAATETPYAATEEER